LRSISKIAGINLLITLIISFFLYLNYHKNLSEIISKSLLFLAIQFLVNLGYGTWTYMKGDEEKGKAFILSTLIIILIGFSLCTMDFLRIL
jgi:hypothetical protein